MVGPIIGAGLVVGLENTLATSGFPVTIATGLIFMVCVLIFRRGIVGELYARLLDRRLARKTTTSPSSIRGGKRLAVDLVALHRAWL